MCNFPVGNVLAAALGPQPILASARGPLVHLSRRALPPLQPAAPQRANLGRCQLGNSHLGNRPWEIAFGKVPNTLETSPNVRIGFAVYWM